MVLKTTWYWISQRKSPCNETHVRLSSRVEKSSLWYFGTAMITTNSRLFFFMSLYSMKRPSTTIFSVLFFLNAWHVFLPQRQVQQCIMSWNHDWSQSLGHDHTTLLLFSKLQARSLPYPRWCMQVLVIHTMRPGKLALLEQSFSHLLLQMAPSPTSTILSPLWRTHASCTKTSWQLGPVTSPIISCQF